MSFELSPRDSSVYKDASFILASVSVPVLSVSITVVAPNVSAASKFLTKPPYLSIDSIPSASTTVTAAGSPSGIVATAIAIAIRNISLNGSPRSIPSPNISTTAAIII